MLSDVKKEMKEYYKTMDSPENNSGFIEIRDKIIKETDDYVNKNPDASPVIIKSKLHTATVRYFEPVVFMNSPFFYEMGLRKSRNWGTPQGNPSPAGILFEKKRKFLDADEVCQNTAAFSIHNKHSYKIYGCVEGFDADHHTLDYRTVFKKGLKGIISEIDEKLKNSKNDFYVAAKESCTALIDVAAKFADAAEEKKKECENEKQIKFMTMISETARRIPGNPPESFYEGLAMIWFLRECIATLDALGISTLGRVDELLGGLYKKDIEEGVLTEAEARELIALWFAPTDIKFFLDESEWPETSTCIELGGYDENGEDIFNDVTRLIIEVHNEYGFVNPKLNCRYSKISSDEYLRTIANCMLNKHNNFALINDDSIIPALINCGFSERDAKCYVNGGCQEIMSDGMGHSAGAYYYLNLVRLFDLSMRAGKINEDKIPEEAAKIVPKPIQNAKTFEDFYEQFLKNTDLFVSTTLNWLVQTGKHYRDINPCPLFSSIQRGCIESGVDYTAGGAKYNHSTTCLCGIGTLADSLYAVKKLVYDDKELTFEEFNEILESNWENNELLRLKCVNLPKYGHGNAEVDKIAKRFLTDLNNIISRMPNERGGKFIASLFVYHAYKKHGDNVRATPDGRRNGDMLNQGVAPGRVKKTENLTDVFETMRNMNYSEVAGVAVLDIALPFSTALNEDILISFIRAAGMSGCPTLQPNILSVDELKEAQTNPAKYKNLMVRVCGLSVYFVKLSKEFQDEIISRNYFSAGL